MTALAVVGPAWVVWLVTTRPGAGQSFAHLYLFGVLVAGVLPGAVGLSAAWFFARRPDSKDRCPTCGHDLLHDQETCPECGGGRQVATIRRIYSGFARQRSSHPHLYAMVMSFQYALALVALIVLALLVVPTPRVVTTQRAKGTSSGTVFSVGSDDDPDFPFTLTNEITSRVTTAASFGGVVPFLPSDVSLEVALQGRIGMERNGTSVGEARTISIARVVRSRADMESLASEMNLARHGIPVDPKRDPMASEAGLFLMIASGYWPAPNPNAPVPTATMARAERWLALGESASPWLTFGVPGVLGALAYWVAFPRQHKREPAPSAA
ncbi:MAG: hypothetical protein JNL80_17740 [Phycisphaerae bacterium]|nr:hypothetical protein [Phycisphaerae bacterium]